MAIPKVITAPAEEPLTIAQVKARLSIADTLTDNDITAYIVTARQEAEAFMEQSIITQTLEIALNDFPEEIELLRGPVQSITSVKYYDPDNVEQTLSSAVYEIDDYRPRTKLVLTPESEWPNTYGRVNAIKVRYVAGWGLAAAVPDKIKTALYLSIDYLARFHSEIEGGIGPTTMPRQFYGFLQSYREIRF